MKWIETTDEYNPISCKCGQPMTFGEAKSRLSKIADGEYHSISYELTEPVPGQYIVECRVYINPSRVGTGKTFEAAFAVLEQEPQDVAEALIQAPEEVEA